MLLLKLCKKDPIYKTESLGNKKFFNHQFIPDNTQTQDLETCYCTPLFSCLQINLTETLGNIWFLDNAIQQVLCIEKWNRNTVTLHNQPYAAKKLLLDW